ncbi:FtsX-like permease family protein [Flavobacteriaceae bacterium AU392]|nr:ABC transporter permease [Flavobacteriaceae bacterium]RKM81464.1 FtsX-like permease family protein [Flavobacteriaceae bacterium AU392]
MFKNYFKIAWRNIMKHKVFSFINVIGLTIGLSASFVIGLMIYYDYTFDTFHEDADRIYRVVTDFEDSDTKYNNSGITLALKDVIADDPNFESIAEFYVETPSKVENRSEDIKINWPQFVIYATPEYFDILSYKFLAGDKTALNQPNKVILTEQRAKNYFPRTSLENIIGKTLIYNDSINISVAGVVENFKNRSDFVFQEFVSHATISQTRLRDQFINKRWGNTNSASQLLIKMKAVTDVDIVQKRLNDLALEHTSEAMKERGSKRWYKLQPLSDIHFNEDYKIFDWTKGQASKLLLRNLALVAIFLLLLGCINFINLNTAQASQRAKEIGIRKTLGSSRKQLIYQFIGETFILVLCSAILSLILSRWLIHVFSDFVPQDLSFELFKTPLIIMSIVVLLLIVTLLSGFYPALVLSKFNTVSILKNNIAVGERKVRLRKFLTIFQFTIAQIFIIGTLLVGRQINYLLNKDMGFKTDAVVSVYSPRSEGELLKKERFVEKLNTIPEINSVSLGGTPPASVSTSTSIYAHLNEGKQVNTTVHFIYGDTNYHNVFEIDLLAGRIYRNDTIKELVINERYSKILGYTNPEDAIGKSVYDNNGQLSIVGVMADFHQRSLKEDIEPMALIGDWYRSIFGFSQFMGVHIALNNETPQNLKITLSKIKEAYASVYTEIDDYRLEFMDETVATFYNREQKISKLLNWATGLSILISCLGLLGLVIYTTNRRVKEIGVRKVLGASLLQLNTLLCKEFLILVAIAFVLAVPVAWYGVYYWLQDFAYKSSISFWVFIIGGIAMISFALLVISIKTLQAANTNPVNSLRSE